MVFEQTRVTPMPHQSVRPAYDHLHPSDAGYASMAVGVGLSLF